MRLESQCGCTMGTEKSFIRLRRYRVSRKLSPPSNVCASQLAGLLDAPAGMDALSGVIIERLSPERPTATGIAERLGLTAAQSAVALLVADGHSNPEIARRLGVSAHTVRHRVEHAFDRLGVRTRGAVAARVRTFMQLDEPNTVEP